MRRINILKFGRYITFPHTFPLFNAVREGFNKKNNKVGGIFHRGGTPPPLFCGQLFCFLTHCFDNLG